MNRRTRNQECALHFMSWPDVPRHVAPPKNVFSPQRKSKLITFRTQVGWTPRQNVCACAHFGHFRFRAYVVHFHSVCFRTVRELNSQGWRSSPVREEKFTLVCSRSPKKKNLKTGHFTLLFCRGLKRNVPECVTHVQSHCFAH